MNQHLETILKFLEQSKDLGVDEKKSISKAVNDAENDIALKEQDLKIEASLERVRGVALSMKKSEDLLNVCEILFNELHALGFDELRNAMINIFNDDSASFLNYDYSDVIYKSITKLFYNTHPVIEKQARQMRTANDAFSETTFSGKELDEWKDFRKKAGEKDDPRLENAPALYYYLYSIGSGSIGISTFSSISEDKRSALKRFRNVFDLAYRRYMDVTQAEAQTREAKIEASLERVRSVALSMNNPDDMLQVCRIISEQLEQLNVKEIRNVQTAIFYESKSTYTNYEFYPKHNKTFITEVYYKGHPVSEEFANQMIKGSNEVFVHSFFGKEVNDWLNYQKTTSVFIDTYLETAPSLNYYWYSLGPVALGMSTYAPLTEDETNLFRRFRNVFELSYRRFLDIELAMGQAREAQIEVSLERVRSNAMAMHSSEELSATVNVFFKELKKLGVLPWRCGVGQIDEKTRTTHLTTTSVTKQGDSFEVTGTLKQEGHPVLDGIYEHWKLQKEYYPILKGAEIKAYYDIVNPQIAYPDYPIDAVQYGHMIFFKEGFVFAWTENKLSENELSIFRRFTSVLSLTFRRYLDLKEAEAQAREAKIEAALERVRSRTMAMQHSDELPETSLLLFRQFEGLGEHSEQFSIGIVNEEERVIEVSATLRGTQLQETYKASIDEPIVMSKVYAGWKAKQKTLTVDLTGQELRDYNSYRKKLSGEVVEYNKSENLEERYIINIAYFSKGILSIGTSEHRPIETLQLLERFAKVFDLTYTRFQDLKQAEEQAREAQIESGLERVRSRTLAMQSSEELAGTAAVVFKQLINLGIEPNRLYICIIKDETGNSEFWITDEDGSKVSSKFTANLNDNPSFKKMFEGWQEQKKSIVIDLHGKELEEYFQHLGELHVPFKDGLAQKRRVQNIAYFSQGFIGIASPDVQPDETAMLLERFAGVFNLTYTRFNDLQVAEAQTHKARIEAAMERVRGRALAMQEPEELIEVAYVLRHEMGLLGLEEIETGTVFIFDEAAETAQFGFTAKDIFHPEKEIVTDDITLDLKQTWAGREVLKFFKSNEIQISIRMEGAQRREWIEYIYSLSPRANNIFGENIQDKTYHMYKFSNGAVGAASTGDISEDSWDLLKRSATVFSFAYSRFKDLTKARFDLQLLKEEKKRSDSLLLNILPEEIASELKQFGKSYARKHEQVTIMFADIKGFSTIAEHLSAEELVTQLDECFRAFDKIIEKHGLEKIKTVGDAYICACGLPKPVNDNAIKTVRAAIDMLDFLKGFGMAKKIQDLPAFEFRFGIHTGSVVTGVVGLKKFTYDLWGDAVNMAARMEQNGEVGRINISGSTYLLVKDKFNCTPRGKIEAKNMGVVDMYFVN